MIFLFIFLAVQLGDIFTDSEGVKRIVTEVYDTGYYYAPKYNKDLEKAIERIRVLEGEEEKREK